MSIIIGADLVPTSSNIHLFTSGNVSELVGSDLLNIIRSSDYRIFNLEVPLVDKRTPIKKNGPCLAAPTEAVKAYEGLNINLLTLANNHIMDQGTQGLYSTKNTLNKAKISFLGADDSLEKAKVPFFFQHNGEIVGVYACAEHEFSIATDFTPGANPIDLLESFDDISKIKSQCDKLIVLYHGGKEHFRYPAPYLQRICRKCIEKGADLIVCQHSHCIGCEEHYKDGTIIYGQGNFIFDDSNSEFWNTSLLISVDNQWKISYIPIVKKKNGVRLADKNDAKQIMDDFRSRSNQIAQVGFVDANYADFSQKKLTDYLFTLTGLHRPFLYRVINRIFHYKLDKIIVGCLYNERNLLAIQNYIACEAHRELLLTGLDTYNRGNLDNS